MVTILINKKIDGVENVKYVAKKNTHTNSKLLNTNQNLNKMYYIREILRIGSDHKQCEDSTFRMVLDDYIFMATLDGCSGGVDSHFASSLFKKILRKVIEESLVFKGSPEEICKIVLNKFFISLIAIKNILTLNLDEILSTIVFSITDFSTRMSFVVISGDGAYMVNDELYEVDQNNQPDYIAYHLNETFEKVWNTFYIMNHENVEDISVMSDGIFTFKNEGLISLEEPMNSLLREQKILKSKAMLPRLCNILDKKGYYHYDDLSIVRLIFIEDNIEPKAIIIDKT